MEVDVGLILLGLPLVFALGWLASRLDLRQLRQENRRAPKAYFRGLNFLLNEQQDQAIDAFIEAVQGDPDTSELHFALGNLFRRRGEYQRAVRVHEHLLSRGDLSQADRQRAQHALALDFLKAGLLDRAEDALRKLEGSRFEDQARLALLSIYERSRDWERAAEVARALQGREVGNFSGRLAHYLCEQAADALAQGQPAQARERLQRAISTAPEAPRARLELARLELAQGDARAAWQALVGLLDHAPAAAPLAASTLVRAAQEAGTSTEALQRVEQLYAASPSVDLLEARIALRTATGERPALAREAYLEHLQREPSLIAASRWIAQARLDDAQCHTLVQRALDHAVKPLSRYRCASCGFEAREHFWHCPGCQAWDSYPPRRVEEL